MLPLFGDMVSGVGGLRGLIDAYLVGSLCTGLRLPAPPWGALSHKRPPRTPFEQGGSHWRATGIVVVVSTAV
jgi:hypothetical protein